MSKTPDLDKAITLVTDMLDEQKKDTKLRLAIIDRLTRLLSLKYKHDDEGKGGKFAVPGETP